MFYEPSNEYYNDEYILVLECINHNQHVSIMDFNETIYSKTFTH